MLSFFKKKRCRLLYWFFLFVLWMNNHILEQVEKVILWKTNLRAHRVDFTAFSRVIGNWWEKPCISHVVNYTIGWESDRRKVSILPDSPNSTGFVAFSYAMGNWWGNPCISQVMKYTIGWESNVKKAPMLWKKYEYQFPRFSPIPGFCWIFLCYGKLKGKPMHFPYNKVYHRMGI